VCSSEADPTALDSSPLYWVGELKLRKAKTLDELNSADREVCHVLASLGVVFNTAELIKHEYEPVSLSRCIGMGVIPSLLTSTLYLSLCCFLSRTLQIVLILFSWHA